LTFLAPTRLHTGGGAQKTAPSCPEDVSKPRGLVPRQCEARQRGDAPSPRSSRPVQEHKLGPGAQQPTVADLDCVQRPSSATVMDHNVRGLSVVLWTTKMASDLTRRRDRNPQSQCPQPCGQEEAVLLGRHSQRTAGWRRGGCGWSSWIQPVVPGWRGTFEVLTYLARCLSIFIARAARRMIVSEDTERATANPLPQTRAPESPGRPW
jgi:hypothetical protein